MRKVREAFSKIGYKSHALFSKCMTFARSIITKPMWLLAFLFCISLVVRLVFVGLYGEKGGLNASSDAKAYHDLATHLVTHHRFITTVDPPHQLDVPCVGRPPLTPFVLAGAYRLFGINIMVAQILFSLIGAVSCVGIFLLGKRLFSTAVGFAAGLIASLYPFFIFLGSIPLTENLGIFFNVFLILSLLGLEKKPIFSLAILSGILLGLNALNKPTILGFLPFLFLWLFIIFKRHFAQTVRIFAVIFLVSMLVIAPWIIRNYLATKQIIPISQNLWVNFYIGNGPETEYSLSALKNGARGWKYDAKTQEASFAGVPWEEIQNRYRTLAFAFIKEHPGKILEFLGRKTLLFWSAYSHLIHQISWGLILSAGVLGVFFSASQWRRLLLIYFLVFQTAFVCILLFVLPRYRAPVEPFIILFAGYAVIVLGKMLMKERWGRIEKVFDSPYNSNTSPCSLD